MNIERSPEKNEVLERSEYPLSEHHPSIGV